MKTAYLICWSLLGLLTISSSCRKQEEVPALRTPYSCTANNAVVKTVTAKEGYVLFDNEVRQYVVNAPRNNGLLTIEVGVLCAPLPVALQVNGVRVVFSGTYSEYSPTLDKGDFYYSHLNLTDIKAK